MKIENIKAQMRKGVLELCVLGILINETMYPSDIIKKLKDNQLIVVEGTMYPLLNRLKRDGYLSHTWVESPAEPARKYYKNTEKGKQNRNNMAKAWDKISHAENINKQQKKPANE